MGYKPSGIKFSDVVYYKELGDGVEHAAYLILIALSLALDAFAVSVSSGVSVPEFGTGQALKLGLWFGSFQFGMSLLGWRLGSGIMAYVAAAGPWISFALLAFIGGRMAAGALDRSVQADNAPGQYRLTVGRTAALAVATSVDALAVGVSLSYVEANILPAAGLIGGAAFLLSVAGGQLGRRLGCLFQRRAELAGGAILILIGARILAEHLSGG